MSNGRSINTVINGKYYLVGTGLGKSIGKLAVILCKNLVTVSEVPYRGEQITVHVSRCIGERNFQIVCGISEAGNRRIIHRCRVITANSYRYSLANMI